MWRLWDVCSVAIELRKCGVAIAKDSLDQVVCLVAGSPAKRSTSMPMCRPSIYSVYAERLRVVRIVIEFWHPDQGAVILQEYVVGHNRLLSSRLAQPEVPALPSPSVSSLCAKVSWQTQCFMRELKFR